MEINQFLTTKITEVNKKMKNLTRGKNKATNKMLKWLLSEKGKQLRPRFLLASAFYFNCDSDVSECAAIIELIHMATLVHDDVIDKSDFRRGKLSIQKKFGAKSAVYLGDYIMFSILRKTKLSKEVYKIILDGIADVYDGEMGQDEKLYDLTITQEQYISNIKGKTATLYGLSTKLGAFLSGATPQMVEKFEKIGIIYGILFQINDDLLDILSQINETGKPVFQDFYNGIYTLPVIMAKRNKEAYKEILYLQTIVKKYGMADEEKDRLLNILRENNALDKTHEVAKDFYDSGKELLETLQDNDTKMYFLNMYDKIYKNITNKCKKRILDI